MIIIRLKGGMGNQLFQYALYKKLESIGKDVFVDLQYYNMPKSRRANREYELPLIGLNPRIASQKDIASLAGKETTGNKILRRLGFRPTYYREYNLRFQSKILKKDNVYLNGYWQSDQYFDEIREILLREITYPNDRKVINSELYQKICSTESVCVTVRRGDYVDNKQNRKQFFACDKAYFENGMKKIKKKLITPTFFAFSDDIKWVEENVDFPGEVFFERGDDPIYEKMRLMSSCKHFLISNSSFSWWVQYLSVNPDKLVYAPRQWYPDGRKTDIYQNNWEYV